MGNNFKLYFMKKLFFVFFLLGTFVFGQEFKLSEDSLNIQYIAKGNELFHKGLDSSNFKEFRFLEKGEMVVFFDSDRRDGKYPYYKGLTKIDSGYYSSFEDLEYLDRFKIIKLKDIGLRRKAAKTRISQDIDVAEDKPIVDNKDVCNNVSIVKNKFTDEVSMYTSYNSTQDFISKTTYFYPSFTKVIKSGKFSYFLSLETHGSIPVVDGRKVYIIFSDGTKWVRDVQVDIEVPSVGSHYIYSAWIELNDSDIKIFKSKTITDYRLDIFEDFINDELGNKLKTEFNCLLQMK